MRRIKESNIADSSSRNLDLLQIDLSLFIVGIQNERWTRDYVIPKPNTNVIFALMIFWLVLMGDLMAYSNTFLSG